MSNEEEWTKRETRYLANICLQGAVTCNSCRLIFSKIGKTDKLLADLRKKTGDSQKEIEEETLQLTLQKYKR